jgi:Tfp pilus assembly protein PilX
LKKGKADARPRERGQVLAGVIMLMMLLLILVPALVQWTQIEAKASVRNQKANTAFNLAEAAVERGYWKIQSTTQTWANASTGTVIAGYNFDVTYTDVPGGTYRIKVSSAGPLMATIVGEGRDSAGKEVRAISAVFKDQTIYSPLMATQSVSMTMGLCPHWGPIMSQSNINMEDNQVGNRYFPRKFAKGVVLCDSVNGTCNSGTNARDINGLTPPNTDNSEWWSNYQLIPPLPVLDFAALRSSATATGTLNVYGCKASAVHTSTAAPYNLVAGAAPWDARASCTNVLTLGGHTEHFSASYNHPLGTRALPNNSYVWYYDGNVVLGGDTTINGTYGVGLRGTLIVRGNLTLDANGDYNYVGPVPANAWAEYANLDKATNDSAASNEYPSDNGFQNSKATFGFGTGATYCVPASGCGWTATVGMRGFTYVGGDLNVTNNGFMDFNGAVWVNGAVIATGATPSRFCGIYYDDQLTLPTLNVILVRQSWKETSPSATAWP